MNNSNNGRDGRDGLFRGHITQLDADGNYTPESGLGPGRYRYLPLDVERLGLYLKQVVYGLPHREKNAMGVEVQIGVGGIRGTITTAEYDAEKNVVLLTVLPVPVLPVVPEDSSL